MKKIVLLVFLLLSGCSYHWQSESQITPISYDAPSHRRATSIGKLRRLVLMPVELEACEGKHDSIRKKARISEYTRFCESLLTAERGYEVLVVSDGADTATEPLQNSAYITVPQNLFEDWSREPVKEHSSSLVQKIGTRLNVDGLVVIWIKERKPWNYIDGLINLALANIPLFYNIATTDRGVWIYETASGQLVYRAESCCEFVDQSPDQSQSKACLASLLMNLENAVPRQLTR
jgi:hypothetical protein